MAKRGSHQWVKEEDRNMFLVSKKPRCCQDHGYFLLLLRTETNTLLNIRLDFSGWSIHSFRVVMLFSLPDIQRTNTQNEGCQHCSARKPDNPLICSFNMNVPFYRLGFMTFITKVNIFQSSMQRQSKYVQDTQNGQIGLERLRRKKEKYKKIQS